jgi:hypothetical protein
MFYDFEMLAAVEYCSSRIVKACGSRAKFEKVLSTSQIKTSKNMPKILAFAVIFILPFPFSAFRLFLAKKTQYTIW